ncbi:uncharacterized protein TNIN_403911 [Trichonephila inaurata madagascariensis]|uniref:Uncharacterized protein n=1 Tax=Trichonephila inaurata madagascariensis TaxID=2747483 RepID=A0A8X6X6J9_9ARAC|nr:uncharacterized protein TNIN_403911 [Trichonephila inaurata madagascariensis]
MRPNAHVSASKPFYHSSKLYVQGELKDLIKERNKARKTWQLTTDNLAQQAKAEFKTDYKTKLKEKIYHYRQQAWEDNLSTLNAEDNSFGNCKVFRKKKKIRPLISALTVLPLSDTNKTEVIGTCSRDTST